MGTKILLGIIIAAVADFLINLLAAAVQQQVFADQFSQQSIWWLMASLVIGLGLSFWLGAEIPVPAPTPAQAPAPKTGPSDMVVMTRFRAILSYAKLRGKGMSLIDILLIASRLDIDTGEDTRD